MFLSKSSPRQKRIFVLVLLIFVLMISVFLWKKISWSEDITDILPGSPELADYTTLAKIFRPDNKVFFLVKKTGENIHEKEIIQKADLLAVELAKAEKGGIKLFSKILYRLDINPFDSINFILENQNIYFNEAQEESAIRRTNTIWMKKRFLDVRKQLLTSSVPGLEKIVINDPLNLSEENFKGLESILPVQGNIRFYKERLFSEDLQKILIIPSL